MKTQLSTNRLTRTIAATVAVIAFASPSTNAFAHHWEIKGREFEAELVDYNETHVLLKSKSGSKKAFPITQLEDDDLSYLSKLVAVRESKSRERYQNQSLRQKQTELLLQATDTWYVTLQDRNGRYWSKLVFADDSRQATNLAHRQYPQARVTGVRRQRNRSRNGFY